MKEIKRFDAKIYDRSCKAIAHGALTNSKRPESFIKGVYPTHVVRGQGCYLWDTNGNRYIDFICGLGANLLGYGNEKVTESITVRVRNGASYSLPSVLEVEAAEDLKAMVPFVEKLRFLKTGSDACTAALIIARAFTGRKKVLSAGYHGWHPEFTSLTPPAHGITQHHDIAFYSDPSQVNSETAAVIIEPVMLEYSIENTERLKRLREACTKHGALLIFDEVITGFRFPEYSVSQLTGVTPDLICMGKAMANGMPISAVGGKAKMMEADYFVSSTFAGDTVSLGAMIGTLSELKKKSMPTLWLKGLKFLDDFDGICHEVVKTRGYATRAVIEGEPLKRALFFQECVKGGILFGPSLFFTFPHFDVLDEVLATLKDVCQRIRAGSVALEGELPLVPYAQKVRKEA